MIMNILGDVIPNDIEPIDGCRCGCECTTKSGSTSGASSAFDRGVAA